MNTNEERDVFTERTKRITDCIATTSRGMMASKNIAQEVFGMPVSPDLVFAVYDRLAKDIQSIGDGY